MSGKHKGRIPNKNYKYLTTVKAINKNWNVYINTIDDIGYILWKFVLSEGRRFKANYLLTFSLEKNRLVKSAELKRFIEDFPPSCIQMVEDISNWFKNPPQKTEMLEGESETPFQDRLIGVKTIDGTCRFIDGRKWQVSYNEQNRIITWSFFKKTKTPVNPSWMLFEDYMCGLPTYDEVEIVYSIDTEETYFSSGERGRNVFLKYCLPEHFKYIKPFSQYLFSKLKESGLIN